MISLSPYSVTASAYLRVCLLTLLFVTVAFSQGTSEQQPHRLKFKETKTIPITPPSGSVDTPKCEWAKFDDKDYAEFSAVGNASVTVTVQKNQAREQTLRCSYVSTQAIEISIAIERVVLEGSLKIGTKEITGPLRLLAEQSVQLLTTNVELKVDENDYFSLTGSGNTYVLHPKQATGTSPQSISIADENVINGRNTVTVEIANVEIDDNGIIRPNEPRKIIGDLVQFSGSSADFIPTLPFAFDNRSPERIKVTDVEVTALQLFADGIATIVIKAPLAISWERQIELRAISIASVEISADSRNLLVGNTLILRANGKTRDGHTADIGSATWS